MFAQPGPSAIVNGTGVLNYTPPMTGRQLEGITPPAAIAPGNSPGARMAEALAPYLPTAAAQAPQAAAAAVLTSQPLAGIDASGVPVAQQAALTAAQVAATASRSFTSNPNITMDPGSGSVAGFTDDPGAMAMIWAITGSATSSIDRSSRAQVNVPNVVVSAFSQPIIDTWATGSLATYWLAYRGTFTTTVGLTRVAVDSGVASLTPNALILQSRDYGDVEVSVTYPPGYVGSAAGSDGCMAMACITVNGDATLSAYVLYVVRSAGNAHVRVELIDFDASAGTLLDITTPVVAGDVLALRVEAGTLTVKKNTVAIGNVLDATFDSGKVGIGFGSTLGTTHGCAGFSVTPLNGT